MISLFTVLSFTLLSIFSIYFIKKNISFDNIDINFIIKFSSIYALITFIPAQLIFDKGIISFGLILWFILGTIVMSYFEFILTDSFQRKTSSDFNLDGILMNFEYSIKRSFILIFFWPIAALIVIYFENFSNSNKYKYFID